MKDRKYLVEPFPLFGVESIIHSKEQALKVLRLNSYYIFLAGFFGLFGFSAIEFFNVDIGMSSTYVLLFAFVFFAIGFLVCWRFLRNIYESGFAGFSIITLLFIAASYRSAKASFFYHNKS